MTDQIEAASSDLDLLKKQETADSEDAKEKAKIGLALSRFKQAVDHESPFRQKSLEDWRFSIGDQWPQDIQSARTADGRPCLTMDQLNQSMELVSNRQRQQRRGVQVNPVGSGATRETAEVIQGIIRHVEVNSDSEVAYDQAFDHMLRGGVGWLRLRSDYTSDDSFDQDLVIDYVDNPFSVYDDPGATGPLKINRRWLFIVESLEATEYKAQYPNSKAAALTDFVSVGNVDSAWASKHAIKVAEYYHLENVKITIYRLSDGSVVKQLPEGVDEADTQKREVLGKKVVWTKMNAIEVLEEHDLPGTMIPVIPVYGKDLVVDGKRYLAGLIRNAKDAQRMYNYQCSAATEMVALAPKAPYIGYVGQFKTKESQWKNLNTKNSPYLEVDLVSVGGQLAPIPQRNVAEPPIEATVKLINQASNDIKAALGIYDASLGQQGPEQSGKAILARQQQGDETTFSYSDNLDRSIRQLGRIMLDWIPAVFDTPRIQRIITPEKKNKHVGVYNSTNGDLSPEAAKELIAGLEGGEAIQEVFDLGVGKYDVAISAGAQYQTMRQEAVASMMELVKVYPQLMQVAGDLLIGNMDWPFAQQISKRLEMSLPPQFQDTGDMSDAAKVARLTAQLTQMSQQHQLLTEAVSQANQLLSTKALELESKERIAAFQAEAELVAASLKAKQAGAQALMEAVFGHIQSRTDFLHESLTLQQEAALNPQPAAAPAAQ